MGDDSAAWELVVYYEEHLDLPNLDSNDKEKVQGEVARAALERHLEKEIFRACHNHMHAQRARTHAHTHTNSSVQGTQQAQPQVTMDPNPPQAGNACLESPFNRTEAQMCGVTWH